MDQPHQSAVDEKTELQKLAPKPLIFVIGGPGSGKDTHCSRIEKDFGFKHISAGDLLRSEVAKEDEQGRQIKQIMKDGLLVPPEITIGLLKTALLSHPDAVGFLINGFPRNLDQGKLFVQQVRECSLLLIFECTDDVLVERVLKRGKTSGRVDDNEETMRKRLTNFHQETRPILEHYQSMGKVRKINSDRPSNEVYADVKAIFNEDPAIKASLHT